LRDGVEKKIAMVALARRLARVLFAMWRDEVGYDPARIRSSPRTTAAASDHVGRDQPCTAHEWEVVKLEESARWDRWQLLRAVP
jgi:hypothetical protein